MIRCSRLHVRGISTTWCLLWRKHRLVHSRCLLWCIISVNSSSVDLLCWPSRRNMLQLRKLPIRWNEGNKRTLEGYGARWQPTNSDTCFTLKRMSSISLVSSFPSLSPKSCLDWGNFGLQGRRTGWWNTRKRERYAKHAKSLISTWGRNSSGRKEKLFSSEAA